MAGYIDEEVLMQKLSRMIDYCEKNKEKRFNALNVLFQVGDAIMDCPTADVVPKSEVEALEKENERLIINMNALGLTVKRLQEEKNALVINIFKEIYGELFEMLPLKVFHLFNGDIVGDEFEAGKERALNDALHIIVELENKYTVNNDLLI